MKILMIVENGQYENDPRVRREANALCAAGHTVSVVSACDGKKPWRELIDNAAVYRFRSFKARGGILSYFLEYAYSMMAIAWLSLIVLLQEGFDVIHVANPPDTIVMTTAIYKLFGKQIIYDQHDLNPELYAAKFSNFSPIVYRFLLWLESQSCRLADQIIATNESYKKTVMARARVSESKITVVRNGPCLQNMQETDVDLELRSRSRNILVYCGGIGVQDGLDRLCGILYQLRYQLGREDFCCAIIGDGDALPQIRKLAAELCLEDNVWFSGWIYDSKRVLRYLNAADICVSPEPSNSFNNRSTFIKIMEFMAVGKPIVAFDLLETRFSAQDCAVYARPNDEGDFALLIAKLMDAPSLRTEMGHLGQKRIRERLAWEYSVPNLLQVYENCARSEKCVCRSKA